MESTVDPLANVFNCPTNEQFISTITSTTFKQYVEGLLFYVKFDWESYFREATKRNLLSNFVIVVLEVIEKYLIVPNPPETLFFNFKSIMDLLSVDYVTEIDYLLFRKLLEFLDPRMTKNS